MVEQDSCKLELEIHLHGHQVSHGSGGIRQLEWNKYAYHHLRYLGRDVAKSSCPPYLWHWTHKDMDDLLQHSSLSSPSFNPRYTNIGSIFLLCIVLQD